MFYPMTLWDQTLLTSFNRRPETWGTVVQTIASDLNRFTCMTTFSHWIVVALHGGLVKIYDIVTGTMRLSLGTSDRVDVMTTSPDGLVLFCGHRERKLTSWDIQTGGLIQSTLVGSEIRDIAVSSKGRYLSCSFSSGFGIVREVVRGVVDMVENVASRKFSPMPHFCWLGSEEQLVVAREALVEISDVAAGTILRSFTTSGSNSDVIYSPELNLLATKSIFEDTVTIIDLQTGISSILPGISARLRSFAFSPTTAELVCGMHGGDLEVFNFSTQSWGRLEYPRPPDFLSSAPNGTVVVGSVESGIQVLSLDYEHTPSRSPHLFYQRPYVSTLDQGRIIVTARWDSNAQDLLETSTLSKLHTTYKINTSTYTLSASLENRIAVHCLEESPGRCRLQLYRFGDRLPKWTRGLDSKLSIIAISPSGTWLVTSHPTERATCHIRMWDTGNGQLQAELSISHLPSDITFDSEMRFYSYYRDRPPSPYHPLSPDYTHSPCRPSSPYRPPSPYHHPYRIPYDLNFSPGAPTTCTIVSHKRQPWTVESGERKYQLDSSREWVTRGPERIFWIPLGYLNSDSDGHCWAGSNTLVMIGESGVVRTLTFRL